MRRVAAPALLGWLVAVGGVARAAPPPEAGAIQILAPKLFPVWQTYNVLFPFVLLDPETGEHWMYYTGTGADQVSAAVWDQWMTGLVTSRDGVRWRHPEDYEPVLVSRLFHEGEVVEGAGRLASFDSIRAYGVCVVRDGDLFRLWYTGWNGDTRHRGGGLFDEIHQRIGLATSPDGSTWTKVVGSEPEGAVLGPDTDAPGESLGIAQPFVVKQGTTFRMWYEGFDGKTWRLFEASSPDGLRWNRHGVVLEPGPEGSLDELGLRNPVVIRRRGAHELWYQGTSRSSPRYHVLRAVSDDGRRWTKRGEVILDEQRPVVGDEAIHADSVLVEPDGACRVFFARQRSRRVEGIFGKPLRSFAIYTERVDP